MTTNVIDSEVGAIRSGVIGAGFMASVHTHASRAAHGTPTAIATSSADGAAMAARRFGFERAAESPEALLDDPSIDVVHICTPNASHAAFAEAAMLGGKNVICEKPLATTAEDAKRLLALSEQRGLIGAVPFVYRYHPMVREARARVASGELGALLSLGGSYLQDWLLDADDDDWRVDAEAGGPSRAFADIGSHLCDLIEFVAGERIIRLSARTRTVYPQRAGRDDVTTEDIAALLVELDSGALGTLLISQLAPGRKNALVLELAGTRESLRFDQEQPEQLWVGRRSGSQLLLRDPVINAQDSARLSRLPAGHPMGYQDAFNAFVADAYDAIAGGDPDGLPTFADGLRAAVLTEAVLRSAASQSWVEVH